MPESKFEDRVLRCKDCDDDFVFSAGEQEFFEMNGLIHDVHEQGQGQI
ncbi:MAG: zinc-ribbon domain containing protein [Candidatus Aenigmarchaeota archaeon]|nr:zinc-ribbon domain containing protein [Candidatus Aenigmarchaeota archaeon]